MSKDRLATLNEQLGSDHYLAKQAYIHYFLNLVFRNSGVKTDRVSITSWTVTVQNFASFLFHLSLPELWNQMITGETANAARIKRDVVTYLRNAIMSKSFPHVVYIPRTATSEPRIHCAFCPWTVKCHPRINVEIFLDTIREFKISLKQSRSAARKRKVEKKNAKAMNKRLRAAAEGDAAAGSAAGGAVAAAPGSAAATSSAAAVGSAVAAAPRTKAAAGGAVATSSAAAVGYKAAPRVKQQ